MLSKYLQKLINVIWQGIGAYKRPLKLIMLKMMLEVQQSAFCRNSHSGF